MSPLDAEDEAVGLSNNASGRVGRQDSAGFTLIELVVAISIATISLIALAGVYFGSLRTSAASSNRSAAASLLTRETEAMRAFPYAKVGFYASQLPPATFEGLPTVVVGAVPLAGVAVINTTDVVTVDRIPYSIERYIVWADAQGFTSLVTPTTFSEAYKKTTVRVTWTDEVGSHTDRQDSIIYPSGQGTYSGPGGSPTTSTTLSLTTPSAPTLNTPVVPLAPVGESQIEVSWSPGSGLPPTSYKVEWSDNPGFASGVVASPQQAATTTSYPVNSLAPATTYYFRVFAYGAGGLTVSPASNVQSATTLASSATSCTPDALNVTGATSGSSTKTYFKQTPAGRMSENLSLVLNVAGCTGVTFSVRATSPSGTADPGSPYALSGTGGVRTGTVGSFNQSSWSLGIHTFTVLRNGAVTTPAVTHTFLVCAYTATPSSAANTC